jgi:hypothetical protein
MDILNLIAILLAVHLFLLLAFKQILEFQCLFLFLSLPGIDGRGGMKRIFGIILAKEKGKTEREDKVPNISISFLRHFLFFSS